MKIVTCFTREDYLQTPQPYYKKIVMKHLFVTHIFTPFKFKLLWEQKIFPCWASKPCRTFLCNRHLRWRHCSCENSILSLLCNNCKKKKLCFFTTTSAFISFLHEMDIEFKNWPCIISCVILSKSHNYFLM